MAPDPAEAERRRLRIDAYVRAAIAAAWVASATACALRAEWYLAAMFCCGAAPLTRDAAAAWTRMDRRLRALRRGE